MTSTIKGLKINVTVDINVNADEIKESGYNQRPGYHKDSFNNYGKNIKVDAKAGFDMQIDSYEGEIELKEFADIIKSNINNTINKQVKEQVKEQIHQNKKG